MPEEQCIVTFPSTYMALRAERVAKKAGIPVRMVPVPRRLSPDCNMGMAVSAEHRDSVKSHLESEGVESKIVLWRR
jgi:hypothetical protein